METDDTVIIICSTPDSRRLPGKCFKKIAGKPALQHILDRIKPLNMETIVAIPNGSFEEYLFIKEKYDIRLLEGNKESPLHRMADAINESLLMFDYIIRITHDDILIDPETVLALLAEVKKEKAGYGITPTIMEGAGIEVIAAENILSAAKGHTEPIEHISYFVKGQGCPNPKIVHQSPRKSIERPYRLTMDYYEDYVVLETILRFLGSDATCDQICEYIDLNPEIIDYNKLPEFTVYTCVRDGEKWLPATLIAIPKQREIERIIVDDASTDGSLNKILIYGGARFKIIINEENKGLASSSNIALSQAKGKYIMRIDCDDILMKDALWKMQEKMNQDGSVICYTNYNEIDEENNIIRRDVDAKEKHHIGCALISKRFLNEMRFKEGIQHWDGLELYNRIKDKFPISYIDEPLWFYRVHDGSMSRNNMEERERCKPL